jgi:DNA-binding MarR family transcriptional regulator
VQTITVLRLPVSVQLALTDISEHPDSTISETVRRTGFPQSLVSSAVARLAQGGVLTTRTDPVDRRRTLVRLAADVPARAARARPAAHRGRRFCPDRDD